jgi:hypothetical protein
MKAETAKKILCNSKFANEVARSRGVSLERVIREATQRLNDRQRRKRKKMKVFYESSDIDDALFVACRFYLQEKV